MLHLDITYDIEADKFEFDSDIKPEQQAEVLSDFIRGQMGKGSDATPPNRQAVYHIRLKLDLADDTFYVEHDCGNKGLRDGILLEALKHLNGVVRMMHEQSPAERHVRAVKAAIKQKLGHPPWFLAIGITLDESTDRYYITLRLRPDHPDLSNVLPDQLDGIDIRIVEGLTPERPS